MCLNNSNYTIYPSLLLKLTKIELKVKIPQNIRFTRIKKNEVKQPIDTFFPSNSPNLINPRKLLQR